MMQRQKSYMEVVIIGVKMYKKLENILTIGPIYPYRGGIAQYGGLLVKNLIKKYQVYNLSFKKMYPSILYPGKFQMDYKNDFLKYENTKFILSTLNPLSYIEAINYVKKVNPDLVIIHWWHPFFAVAYLPILWVLKKKFSICICCNNVLPHDNIPFRRVLTKWILKQGHSFIIHSKEEEKIFNTLMPDKEIYFSTVCPNLNVIHTEKHTKESARKCLGLENKSHVLLFFGFVRKYKGLFYLLKALPDIIRNNKNTKLLIAGEFYEDKTEYLKFIENNGLKKHVIIHEEFIPDDEVEIFFKAADVVILPYVSATSSGVIQVAYQYGCPVIASRVGGLPEAVNDGKTGYLVPPCDSTALAGKINYFFSEKSTQDWKLNIKQEQNKYSWNRMIEGIEMLWNQMRMEERGNVMKQISVASPNLNGNEKRYVDDCMNTTQISSGGGWKIYCSI